MHPFLTIADRAARLAGRRVMQALDNRDRLKIYEKASHEVVTELDYVIERLLIDHIHAAYPTHSILAEESGLLKRDEDYLWLIDPLDGTTNFIHGLPGFSISIGVQTQGVLSQALVYDPLVQETFYASRGQGARLYQRRLAVSQHRKLQHALLYINRPPTEFPELKHWSTMMQSLGQQSSSIRLLGSAALGLAYVAAGRLDGFLSVSLLKPWDIAAGVLLVEEAGGTVCDITGGEKYLETGKLIAANSALCKNLLQLHTTCLKQ
jgi:myo-inositol-1(or 4)-monophosphatase